MNINNDVTGVVVEIVGRSDFSSDQDLLESTILDSFGVFSLITALEEKFNIRFEQDDIDAKHFKNIKNIVAMVETIIKRQASG